MRRRSLDLQLDASDKGLAILTRLANLVKSTDERLNSDQCDEVKSPQGLARMKGKASSNKRSDGVDAGSAAAPKAENTTTGNTIHKSVEKVGDDQRKDENSSISCDDKDQGLSCNEGGKSGAVNTTAEAQNTTVAVGTKESAERPTATNGSEDGRTDDRASQTETLCRELRNIKVAMGNMLKEVQQSYEAAHGVGKEKALALKAPGSQFLEAQEVKKTFYMAEVTSATAELAELLMERDAQEFKNLRDATKTLYELQTRKTYFKTQRTEPKGGFLHSLFMGYTGIVIILLCSALRGDWFNLCVAVVLLLGRLVAGAVASGLLRGNI